jgi:hypothetical protein
MKTPFLAGATLAFLAAINLSPAMAQGPKLSGGNTWSGTSQRVDPAVSTAIDHEMLGRVAGADATEISDVVVQLLRRDRQWLADDRGSLSDKKYGKY